jgi:type III secretory pathway lipoprotein EscJ
VMSQNCKTMDLFYCYGVIGRTREFHDIPGFENRTLFFVQFNDIYAVVSMVPPSIFSQKALNQHIKSMEWLTEHAPIHERVVEAIGRVTTIVPMNFCTIFQTQEKIRKMLEKKYSGFKENLHRLDGKIEMSVKIFVDTTSLKKQVHDPRITVLEDEKQKKTPGAAYFVQQKIDNLVQQCVQQLTTKMIRALHTALRNLAENSVTKNVNEKEMVSHAVFLVCKKDVRMFKNTCEHVASTFPGLSVSVAGGFTPYHFVRSDGIIM